MVISIVWVITDNITGFSAIINNVSIINVSAYVHELLEKWTKFG